MVRVLSLVALAACRIDLRAAEPDSDQTERFSKRGPACC